MCTPVAIRTGTRFGLVSDVSKTGSPFRMEGYELRTVDDDKVGEVVATWREHVIVERGRLRKSRHAVPAAFVEPDDAARVAHTTLSKSIIEDSPEVGEGDVDEEQIARYYGLSAGEEAPETLGYGVVNDDDPARGPAADAQAADLPATEAERARIRQGSAPGEGPLDSSSSPGVTGGDRFRDAPCGGAKP
jgi:hypothetical protein